MWRGWRQWFDLVVVTEMGSGKVDLAGVILGEDR